MRFLLLCLTALGSFVVLFLIAKLAGHKQIAQLDFFDYITGISIGSIAAEMATELELLFTELIMDGQVLEENLKRMGLELTWLNKQLEQRHIHSPKDVFLALCDRNLKFVLYEKERNKN